ncbi:MAG: right-handed parallel beta-helix repeat-containing protein [Acidobacteriota bacterium]
MNRSAVDAKIRRLFILILFAGTVAMVPAASVFASGGRIPVYQPGTVIQASGSYYLTRDLDGTALSSDVITIQADDVTLDLNGHTLTAAAGYAGVSCDLHSNVTVRNGSVSGGTYGISLTSCSSIRIDHISASGFASAGIYAVSTSGNPDISGVIEHCSMDAGGASVKGILVEQASALVIRDNDMANASGDDGIYAYNSNGLDIAGNGVRGFGTGIFVYLCNNCRIENNTASNNTGAGIEFDGNDNLVRGNTTNANTGSAYAGIDVMGGGFNVIAENTASRNGGYGIHLNLNGANVFLLNRTLGNSGGGISGTTGNTNGGGNQ